MGSTGWGVGGVGLTGAPGLGGGGLAGSGVWFWGASGVVLVGWRTVGLGGGPGGHRLGLGDDQHLGRRRNISHRISDESFEIFGSRRPDGIILVLESIFTKCNIPDLINNDTAHPYQLTYIIRILF